MSQIGHYITILIFPLDSKIKLYFFCFQVIRTIYFQAVFPSFILFLWHQLSFCRKKGFLGLTFWHFWRLIWIIWNVANYSLHLNLCKLAGGNWECWWMLKNVIVGGVVIKKAVWVRESKILGDTKLNNRNLTIIALTESFSI